MGQAKRRGNLDHRVEQSQLARQIVEMAFPDKKVRKQVLRKFNNDMRALANEVIRRQRIGNLDQRPEISDIKPD